MLVTARYEGHQPFTLMLDGQEKSVRPGQLVEMPLEKFESLRNYQFFLHSQYNIDNAARDFKDGYIGYTSAINRITGYGKQGYHILRNMVRSDLHVTFFHNERFHPPSEQDMYDQAALAALLREDRANPEWGVLHGVIMDAATLPYDKKLIWTMWEANRLPDHRGTNTPFEDWPNKLNNHCHAVIVPAEAQIEIFRDSGVRLPIEVVHDVVDTDYWSYEPRRTNKNRPFTFFVYGYMNERKMPYQTVNSFLSAFGDSNMDVRLVVKTVDHVFGHRHTFGVPTFRSLKNVEIIDEIWSEEKLREYIRDEVDAGFFLSHGEGFGDPPLEMLSMGVPVVVPNHSGLSEYVERSKGKKVGILPVETHHMEPAPQAPEYMQWWVPDLDQAIFQLREVYKNYDKYVREAANGSKWVKERWGLDHHRKDMMAALNRLCV